MKKITLTSLLLVLFGLAFSQTQDAWISRTLMPNQPERLAPFAFSIGDYGYVGSGSYGNFFKDFWRYDPQSNTWSRMTDFPGTGRNGAVSFVIAGKAYVGMGNTSSAFLKDLWEYDPATNVWTEKNGCPGVMDVTMAFAVGDKGYFVSGSDKTNVTFYNDVWEYDPTNNAWSQKSNFPGDARAIAATFTINDRGYMCAGFKYASGNVNLKDVWSYDPVADEWTRKADLPAGFGGGIGMTIGNKGFVMNGRSLTSGIKLNKLFEYNPGTDVWVERTPFTPSRLSAAGFSIRNRGYLGYGSPDGNYFREYTMICTPPEITIAGPSSICDGGSATLVASGGAEYRWSLDDSYSSNNASLEVTPETTTTYTVYAADENYCPAQKTFALDVIKLGADFIADDNLICDGETASFHFQGQAPDATNFQWDLDGGTFTSVDQTTDPVVSWSAFGEKHVTLTLSKNGCTAEFAKTISYNPLPSADFDVNTDLICESDTVKVKFPGTFHEEMTFDWTLAAGLVTENKADTALRVKWNAAGEKEIGLTVTYLGCSNTSTQTLEVRNRPQANFQFDSEIYCSGEVAIVEYTGEQSGGSVFSWDFHDASIESGSDDGPYNLTWDTPGEKIVSLVVEENGCLSTVIEKTIDHRSLPPAGFVVQAEAICEVDDVKLKFDAPLQDGMSFQWSLDGAVIKVNKADTVLIVQWLEKGTKQVELKVTYEGCSDATTKAITIKNTPQPAFHLDAELYCDQAVATVGYTGEVPANATFDWDFRDAQVLSGSGAGPYELVWNTPGRKIVSLEVVEDGCHSLIIDELAQHSNYPHPEFETTGNVCFDGTYSIEYTGQEVDAIAWNFGDAQVVSGAGNGPYALKWIGDGAKEVAVQLDNGGCVVDSTFSVLVAPAPIIPQLCIVTVDEETSRNKLVWSYNQETVDKFGIYRETNASGTYELVEYVDASAFSYIDEASLPEQRANRYAISAVDTCGVETVQGDVHKTIHLTINQGVGYDWNLIWDNYEGFTFNTFRIHRSLSGAPFELLTEIASNLTSFTDVDVLGSEVAYQIEVVSPNDCDVPTGGRTKTIVSSRSNVVREMITGVERLSGTSIRIFPNPVKDALMITESSGLPADAVVFGVDGRTLISANFSNELSLDVNTLPRGFYFVKVKSKDGVLVRKVVKE